MSCGLWSPSAISSSVVRRNRRFGRGHRCFKRLRPERMVPDVVAVEPDTDQTGAALRFIVDRHHGASGPEADSVAQVEYLSHRCTSLPPRSGQNTAPGQPQALTWVNLPLRSDDRFDAIDRPGSGRPHLPASPGPRHGIHRIRHRGASSLAGSSHLRRNRT